MTRSGTVNRTNVGTDHYELCRRKANPYHLLYGSTSDSYRCRRDLEPGAHGKVLLSKVPRMGNFPQKNPHRLQSIFEKELLIRGCEENI